MYKVMNLEQQLKKDKRVINLLLKDTKDFQNKAQESDETLSDIQSKEENLDQKIDQSIEHISKQNPEDIIAKTFRNWFCCVWEKWRE